MLSGVREYKACGCRYVSGRLSSETFRRLFRKFLNAVEQMILNSELSYRLILPYKTGVVIRVGV